jgi:Rho termination factor, N-terminal domain
MRRLIGIALAATVIGAVWVLLRDLLAEREIEESLPASDSSPATTGASGNGAGGPSKAELYREAQELEVEGRSKMTKQQLAEAVAAARRAPTQ